MESGINKYKVWMISRLDQATLLVRHLKDNNQLARWDSFIRLSRESFLSQKFFPGSKRLIDKDLASVPGNHYMPEVLGKVAKFFKYKDFEDIPSILLAKISAKNMPKGFDILHGQGNYSLESGILAQKKGKLFVSEVSGQMGITRNNQCKDLYKKFNLPFKIGAGPILQQKRLTEAKIADAVICPSESVSDELKKLGIKNDKIYIATHDSPFSRDLVTLKSEEKKLNKKIIILYVGQILLFKGIHHLISIQKKLHKEGVKSELHLVGKIVDNFLVKNTKDYNIFCHGPVYKEKLKYFYSTADIFLFPTYTEGAALATLEAMASGLPVITTEAAGSIIENRISGFVCKSGDEDQMYKYTFELATNQKLRREIAINSRLMYKKKMNQGYGKSVCQIYEHILKKKL